MATSLELRLKEAVDSGDVAALEAVVETNTHHGRPGINAAAKHMLAAYLTDCHGEGTQALFEQAMALSESRAQGLRCVAALLLTEHWQPRRDAVMERAQALASDDDWEVREWAAGIFGAALERDFEAEYSAMLALTASESDRVRRAVVLAAMQAASTSRPERAEPLLDLLERMLSDAAEYVRKNLGPFALGDKMLSQYPEQTLARLEVWSRRDDLWTRWNVAMAASSANAAKHAQRLRPLLSRLGEDPRKPIQNAVRAAERNLAKRAQPVAR